MNVHINILAKVPKNGISLRGLSYSRQWWLNEGYHFLGNTGCNVVVNTHGQGSQEQQAKILKLILKVHIHSDVHTTSFFYKTKCAWSRDQMTLTSHHMTSKNRMRHLIKNNLCAYHISHYLQISTKITTFFFFKLAPLNVHCFSVTPVCALLYMLIHQGSRIAKYLAVIIKILVFRNICVQNQQKFVQIVWSLRY